MGKKRAISPKYRSKRSVKAVLNKRSRSLKLLKTRKSSSTIIKPKRNYGKSRKKSPAKVKRSRSSPNPPSSSIQTYDLQDVNFEVERFKSIKELEFIPVFYIGATSQKIDYNIPLYHCVLGAEDKDADINIFGGLSSRGIYDIIGLTACQPICILLDDKASIKQAVDYLDRYSGGIVQPGEGILIIEMADWSQEDTQVRVREFIYGHTCNS